MALRASGTTARETCASWKERHPRGLIPDNRITVSGTILDQTRVRAASLEAQASVAVVPEARSAIRDQAQPAQLPESRRSWHETAKPFAGQRNGVG